VVFAYVNEDEEIKVRLCDSGKVAFGRVENAKSTKTTIKVKVVKSGADIKLSGLSEGDLPLQGSVVGRLYKKDNQITGNVGLYYVCYLLSRGERRWNVMPTARNARGIDVVAYPEEDQGNNWPLMIQVKTLSEKSPLPLGKDLRNIVGDFWIVVVLSDKDPGVYVMTPGDIRSCVEKHIHGETQDQYWLSPKEYGQYIEEDPWGLGAKLFTRYKKKMASQGKALEGCKELS